jgi:hypothetical protein
MTKSAEVSEDAFDFAYYCDILGYDRVHEIILRLKSDVIGFLVESLDCSTGFESVIDKSYDNLSVGCFVGFLHNKIVSVIDAYIDHAVAVYGQNEIVARTDKSCRHRELVNDVLLCKDRFTCCDLTDNREGDGIDVILIGRLD